MADDAPALYQSQERRLAELRRARHHRLRCMAGRPDAVLSRHGPKAVAEARTGSHQQRRPVLSRELPLGFPKGQRSQPAQQSTSYAQRCFSNLRGVGGPHGAIAHLDPLPAPCWVECGAYLDDASAREGQQGVRKGEATPSMRRLQQADRAHESTLHRVLKQEPREGRSMKRCGCPLTRVKSGPRRAAGGSSA